MKIFYFFLFYLLFLSKIKKVTILGTNDMHGRIFPDKNDKLDLKIGGLSLFSSYLKVLRKTEDRLLWLDGGDLFTGTLES